MKRKVIQLAGKTYVVSLPSKWVKKYGVKKGDEVEVNEQSNSIILSTASTEPEKAQVDISNLNERTIRWLLSGLHKKGYEEIELLYDTPEKTRLLQELVKDLFIGFAVTHQTSKRCTLRAVSKDSPAEFDNLLRRAFLVTLSLADGIADYIESSQLKQLNELKTLEKTNNQLTNFCERTLNRTGKPKQSETCFYYVIAWNLEKICDDYKYICELLAEQKTPVSKEGLKMLKDTNNFLRDYYNIFYEFDAKKLSDIQEKRKELQNRIFKAIQKTSSPEAVMLTHAAAIITKTADFSASMLTLRHNIS